VLGSGSGAVCACAASVVRESKSVVRIRIFDLLETLKGSPEPSPAGRCRLPTWLLVTVAIRQTPPVAKRAADPSTSSQTWAAAHPALSGALRPWTRISSRQPPEDTATALASGRWDRRDGRL
jgi:hypothetical protein